MFCNQCGTENRNDRKFCMECGAKLKDYTKPVQNPIFPSDISTKQENVLKKKKFNKTMIYITISLLALAGIFVALSIFLTNLKTTFLICATICFVLVLIVACVDFIATAIMNHKNKKNNS